MPSKISRIDPSYEAARRGAGGLRRISIRVHDTRQPGFADECDRQARLVRDAEAGQDAVEAEAWFEISDRTGWT